MRKNQKANQVNDPWYIPAVPTGKPEFGSPNCPVRALCYYHRYLTEHPELRKDRRRLSVPIKDNNAGKELSASTISRWICTTIVDSHAAIQNSTNLSGSVKAHEVRAVATSLQLFNKVDLHSVMKAGRWSSGTQGDSSDGIFICGSHIVFAALEPGLTDCPPFSVRFWNNPKCHMNYL